jgi:hypothetical protein
MKDESKDYTTGLTFLFGKKEGSKSQISNLMPLYMVNINDSVEGKKAKKLIKNLMSLVAKNIRGEKLEGNLGFLGVEIKDIKISFGYRIYCKSKKKGSEVRKTKNLNQVKPKRRKNSS